jgi:hypothetical protein
MLLNLSHDLAQKQDLISTHVGKPFDLEKRKELDGISLTEIPVTAASIDLYNLMVLNESQVFCSIEMRPKGVIISFKANTDLFSLVIPFYKLKIYKGRAQEYSFYKDHYFIKVWAGEENPHIHAFIRKIKNYQADSAHPRIEDML